MTHDALKLPGQWLIETPDVFRRYSGVFGECTEVILWDQWCSFIDCNGEEHCVSGPVMLTRDKAKP